MKTTQFLIALILALAHFSCFKKESPNDPALTTFLPNAPSEVESVLLSEFPEAVSSQVFSKSILHHLGQKYHITPDKILLGASTCVDDIIYTKNFHLHPEIKGPFHLGGLAGLPFTGISGLEAFAHHIPDSGTMVLLIEPHIGYSQKTGWGYVLRQGQHQASTCCGALMGTLGKLKKMTLPLSISEDDYQGGKIAELALLHKNEIVKAANPIIELTKLVSKEAENRIKSHVLEVDLSHLRYVVIITGLMINTDYAFTDYQYLEHFLVYDVKRKSFMEETDHLVF
jgi:hypothetical protein